MAYLSCTSDFSPLFRLLDDYETHRAGPTRSRTFTPSFDVREQGESYYLDGELPGVNQSNIDIEFSDPHTLVIKGHTERDYETHETSNDAPRWRQPTVEDDDESDSTSSASVTSSKQRADQVQVQARAQAQAQAQAQAPKFHYWASERSVGEFQRTFTFPTRVDQDGVRASLKNGILSVVVPKQSAPKTKKIRVE